VAANTILHYQLQNMFILEEVMNFLNWDILLVFPPHFCQITKEKQRKEKFSKNNLAHNLEIKQKTTRTIFKII
jgi:hypothetical protein